MFIQNRKDANYKRTAERGFNPYIQGKLAPIRREQAKVAMAILEKLEHGNQYPGQTAKLN